MRPETIDKVGEETGRGANEDGRSGGRPRVLVIAGFDQSGGAGVLADVKTLEAHGVYGYAVCTALTFQNERVVTRVDWLKEEDVLEQIDLCFRSGVFEFVKMGITPSLAAAGSIIRHLRQHNPEIKIVMDPVIRSSSGTEFWRAPASSEFEEIASMVYMVTPNWEEIGCLYPGERVLVRCQDLSLSTGAYVYLKGGHDPLHPGRDYLAGRGEIEVLEPLVDPSRVSPKHGSGCVLASSLTAELALGQDPVRAAIKAKRYTEQFLTSNTTLLGWHRPILGK